MDTRLPLTQSPISWTLQGSRSRQQEAGVSQREGTVSDEEGQVALPLEESGLPWVWAVTPRSREELAAAPGLVLCCA